MEIQEQIKAWKEQHKSVYKAVIGDVSYYFRGLTREDFLSISQRQLSETAFDSELETVRTCLLEPKVDEEYLKNKPGIVTILSEQIMIRSGFQTVEVEEL
jgi:hypothetical protein